MIINMYIGTKCPVDDDLLFTETNFTISNGNRICFDVIIIDDDVIEYMKYYYFYLRLQNGTYHNHFRDDTHIIVTDNEGWCSLNHCLNLLI